MMLGEDLIGIAGVEVKYGTIRYEVGVAAEVLKNFLATNIDLESCVYKSS